MRPCLPPHKQDDKKGNDNLISIIGSVLGVLIVLLLSAIVALKLIQMLRRKRRQELHSQGEILH